MPVVFYITMQGTGASGSFTVTVHGWMALTGASRGVLCLTL